MDKGRAPRSGIPVLAGSHGNRRYPSPSRKKAECGAHQHLHGNTPTQPARGRGDEGISSGQPLERSVVGCEATSDPYADPAGHFPCPDGQEAAPWLEDCTTQTDQLDAVPQARVTQDGAKKVLATPAPEVEPVYPIRGTFSPLSGCSQVAVKRSLGPVDEVSFVFGRPASPCGERQTPPRLPGVRPSRTGGAATGISRKAGRAWSPCSDVPPARRGVNSVQRDSRRVLSPPPALRLGGAAEARAACETCSGCLVTLKRLALTLLFAEGGNLAQCQAQGSALVSEV
ncbi:hypothetical protein EGW08_018667 [Elysia chlorotica]|uniref:Uncharacterized protein n=1 Tax=Elysia chlorotica TaxID=188477 RepID=A0A3S0Z953_ELYCH|nr:hypothetical protein EGW08_018667 [Elysia chlorotica]